MVRALASHQCGPGSILLLGRYFAPRGSAVFPSPQKPAFPNSNSTRNHVDQETLMYVLPPNCLLFVICFLGGGGEGGGFKVLIQDTHHLCTLLRTDGIKVMSRGFSGGK